MSDFQAGEGGSEEESSEESESEKDEKVKYLFFKSRHLLYIEFGQFRQDRTNLHLISTKFPAHNIF